MQLCILSFYVTAIKKAIKSTVSIQICVASFFLTMYIEQHCLIELSVVMEMYYAYICIVQYSSH